ncbi:hypothetical protein QN219_19070, partial [Sinorhizobium sp. 7-81]|uniref:hypothetical protein n=1 Tax=Sinorhizobium sp. 8-89 TaxID=3049089 RepID=UPI0024C2F188
PSSAAGSRPDFVQESWCSEAPTILVDRVPFPNKTGHPGKPIIHHKPIGNAIPILSQERSFPATASGRHPLHENEEQRSVSIRFF